MEEYMEPEISWVKFITKNIVLGSQGSHFVHMRVNRWKIIQKHFGISCLTFHIKFWYHINPLRIRFNKIAGVFKTFDETRYLTLFFP